MKSLHRVPIVALIFAALAASWGCSTAPDGPAPSASKHPRFYRDVAPHGPSSAGVPRRATAESLLDGLTSQVKVVDGLLGGVVDLGNWRLVVPQGAYQGNATITLQLDSTAFAICHLSIDPPSKNSFKKPVTLGYHLRNATEVSSHDMLWWDPAAETWRVVTTRRDFETCTVSADLWHFSSYGMGENKGKAGW